MPCDEPVVLAHERMPADPRCAVARPCRVVGVPPQAGEVASDTELHRGRIANSGTVETVGPLPGHMNEYAVVTRERTSAADDAAYRGLAPEWHVSVATVTRVGGGRWALSGWQPES